MATIKPLNRWTEQEDNQVRIYSVSNPHYYQDKTGTLHPVDWLSSQSKNNSNIGNFQLYEKNIHSVGIRSGSNNTTKYLGIRPDTTQEDGSQQMEWSIEGININGNNITPRLINRGIDVFPGELGDYLGKSDIAQMRMFLGSYDMHNLLMINQDLQEGHLQ